MDGDGAAADGGVVDGTIIWTGNLKDSNKDKNMFEYIMKLS